MAMPFLTVGELFQGISKAEARMISGLCSERRYPRGTSIFSKSDPSDCLCIVKSGLVKLISHSEKGTATILHFLYPDEVFGELLLSEEKRPFTAIAIEDSLVTTISRDRFTQLLTSVPTVTVNLIRLLSKRLVKVMKRLAESGHTCSYYRLAKVLHSLAEDHGVESPTGTLIPIRLAHEDLANLIGTTRQTVTTQLNKFERMGLLNRQDRQIVVDKSRLSEFIHSEEIRVSKVYS